MKEFHRPLLVAEQFRQCIESKELRTHRAYTEGGDIANRRDPADRKARQFSFLLKSGTQR